MNTFHMTGTTGTKFTGISQLSAGKLGFRSLDDGSFRVRVEPAPGQSLDLDNDWNQPQGGPGSRTYRYSKVVNGAVELTSAIAEAQKALDVASVKFVPAHTEVKLVEQIVTVPDSITIQ